MAEYDLSFSLSSSTDGGSFKLLELPSDLCNLIEASIETMAPLSLTVKGLPRDDAVLCTNDRTFAMRSIVLSNSVLIISPPPDGSSEVFSDDGVVIRDQVNEIVELVPSVPKLHKLAALLKGKDYDEGQEDDTLDDDGGDFNHITYQEARAEIQASDIELHRGIRGKHVLIINGQLRSIAPAYLNRLLELILNILVSLSLAYHAVPVQVLSSTLADEHGISRVISTQVMSWFGDIVDGKWKVDFDAVMKEVGLGILRNHKHEPIEKKQLITKWKSLVGDTFETSVDLSLLSGNYLASTSSTSDEELLSYFPASALAADPARRFADLFLTRSRWRGDSISPFLADIAINSKERDKLLLKFTRATTDAQGVWYTARAQYNG